MGVLLRIWMHTVPEEYELMTFKGPFLCQVQVASLLWVLTPERKERNQTNDQRAKHASEASLQWTWRWRTLVHGCNLQRLDFWTTLRERIFKAGSIFIGTQLQKRKRMQRRVVNNTAQMIATNPCLQKIKIELYNMVLATMPSSTNHGEWHHHNSFMAWNSLVLGRLMSWLSFLSILSKRSVNEFCSCWNIPLIWDRRQLLDEAMEASTSMILVSVLSWALFTMLMSSSVLCIDCCKCTIWSSVAFNLESTMVWISWWSSDFQIDQFGHMRSRSVTGFWPNRFNISVARDGYCLQSCILHVLFIRSDNDKAIIQTQMPAGRWIGCSNTPTLCTNGTNCLGRSPTKVNQCLCEVCRGRCNVKLPKAIQRITGCEKPLLQAMDCQATMFSGCHSNAVDDTSLHIHLKFQWSQVHWIPSVSVQATQKG